MADNLSLHFQCIKYFDIMQTGEILAIVGSPSLPLLHAAGAFDEINAPCQDGHIEVAQVIKCP